MNIKWENENVGFCFVNKLINIYCGGKQNETSLVVARIQNQIGLNGLPILPQTLPFFCFHLYSLYKGQQKKWWFLVKILLFTKIWKKKRMEGSQVWRRGDLSVSLLLFFCLKIGDNQNNNKRWILLSWLLDLQIFFFQLLFILRVVSGAGTCFDDISFSGPDEIIYKI